MLSFAVFRLPYASECTLIVGETVELTSCAELSSRQGFVVAPFAPSASCPILLIRPERVSPAADVETLLASLSLTPLPSAADKDYRTDYHIDFDNFHARILHGDFQKLVLSRSIDLGCRETVSPFALFQRACRRYPRMFISLVFTPQSGLWLTSTPEILLAGDGHEWQTIALAGTMPFSESLVWSEKNIEEQRYVATYIISLLKQFAADFTEQGPYTARAGHLGHLRSDFRFVLKDECKVGDLLQALHPTPAVCGLPKEEAFSFILQNEHHERSYYSGFMGPLSMGVQTSLFVTLRCMRLYQNGCRLYAGGGLLKDSDEEQEWQETETKLDTMRNVVENNLDYNQ